MNNTAIVLTIFDGYEDLWDDCIKLIKKNWINHPPIYVFTNKILRQWDDVVCIPVGEDAEWSRKVQKAVEIVKEDYIILLLEDFYIGKKIDINQFDLLLDFVKTEKIKYVKLCENNEVLHFRKKRFKKGLPYEVIYQDESYGISLQASLWEKNFLSELVGSQNYNAWIFELNQVKKSLCAEHIPFDFAVEDHRNILNIKHGALQGKMLPNTVNYFKKINMPLTTQRDIMSKKEYNKYFIKQLGQNIIPNCAKGFVKKIAEKFGYSFIDKKWS